MLGDPDQLDTAPPPPSGWAVQAVAWGLLPLSTAWSAVFVAQLFTRGLSCSVLTTCEGAGRRGPHVVASAWLGGGRPAFLCVVGRDLPPQSAHL